MIDTAYLENTAREYGFELTGDMLVRFDKYSDLLCEWNEKINLTAITDPAGIADKHFIDSLLLLSAVDVKNGARIADIGTGAGFPSVPVKIVRGDIDITLVDSLNKRINFLNELSSALDVDSVCIHARAEELARNKSYREAFDVVCARAVAKLPALCEYCLPFVKTGGVFAALKGPDANTEAQLAANAIKILGGKIDKICDFTLPDGDKRCIVVVKKISQTPTKYPRQSVKISKCPL